MPEQFKTDSLSVEEIQYDQSKDQIEDRMSSIQSILEEVQQIPQQSRKQLDKLKINAGEVTFGIPTIVLSNLSSANFNENTTDLGINQKKDCLSKSHSQIPQQKIQDNSQQKSVLQQIISNQKTFTNRSNMYEGGSKRNQRSQIFILQSKNSKVKQSNSQGKSDRTSERQQNESQKKQIKESSGSGTRVPRLDLRFLGEKQKGVQIVSNIYEEKKDFKQVSFGHVDSKESKQPMAEKPKNDQDFLYRPSIYPNIAFFIWNIISFSFLIWLTTVLNFRQWGTTPKDEVYYKSASIGNATSNFFLQLQRNWTWGSQYNDSQFLAGLSGARINTYRLPIGSHYEFNNIQNLFDDWDNPIVSDVKISTQVDFKNGLPIDQCPDGYDSYNKFNFTGVQGGCACPQALLLQAEQKMKDLNIQPQSYKLDPKLPRDLVHQIIITDVINKYFDIKDFFSLNNESCGSGSAAYMKQLQIYKTNVNQVCKYQPSIGEQDIDWFSIKGRMICLKNTELGYLDLSRPSYNLTLNATITQLLKLNNQIHYQNQKNPQNNQSFNNSTINQYLQNNVDLDEPLQNASTPSQPVQNSTTPSQSIQNSTTPNQPVTPQIPVDNSIIDPSVYDQVNSSTINLVATNTVNLTQLNLQNLQVQNQQIYEQNKANILDLVNLGYQPGVLLRPFKCQNKGMVVCSNFTDYEDTFCVANLADCPITDLKNQFHYQPGDAKPNTLNISQPRYRFYDIEDFKWLLVSNEFNALPLTTFRIGFQPCIVRHQVGIFNPSTKYNIYPSSYTQNSCPIMPTDYQENQFKQTIDDRFQIVDTGIFMDVMNQGGLRETLGKLDSLDKFWAGSYFSNNNSLLNFYARQTHHYSHFCDAFLLEVSNVPNQLQQSMDAYNSKSTKSLITSAQATYVINLLFLLYMCFALFYSIFIVFWHYKANGKKQSDKIGEDGIGFGNLKLQSMLITCSLIQIICYGSLVATTAVANRELINYAEKMYYSTQFYENECFEQQDNSIQYVNFDLQILANEYYKTFNAAEVTLYLSGSYFILGLVNLIILLTGCIFTQACKVLKNQLRLSEMKFVEESKRAYEEQSDSSQDKNTKKQIPSQITDQEKQTKVSQKNHYQEGYPKQKSNNKNTQQQKIQASSSEVSQAEIIVDAENIHFGQQSSLYFNKISKDSAEDISRQSSLFHNAQAPKFGDKKAIQSAENIMDSAQDFENHQKNYVAFQRHSSIELKEQDITRQDLFSNRSQLKNNQRQISSKLNMREINTVSEKVGQFLIARLAVTHR